ncbi:unnamed protein product [Ilex paraguariensis]|uniref:DUF7903 domain-containing protein n=1 Tax=Ilex paraguariensis TaxID=185542 RepID=A0ABC8QL55_9AQUA
MVEGKALAGCLPFVAVLIVGNILWYIDMAESMCQKCVLEAFLLDLAKWGDVSLEVIVSFDDEMDSIRSLVSFATFDPKVKGGLRWRFGKESSGDRYTVVGVWHIKAKAYRGSSIRLKIRDADRFDFLSSAGEVTCEVTVKMTSIVSHLLVNFCVVVDSVICLCR